MSITPSAQTAIALITQAIAKLDEAAYAGCPGMVTAAEPLIEARDLLRVPSPGPIDVINGFCHAANRMNLHQFCELLHWNEDQYAEDKFLDFQLAARVLGRFDNPTLAALIADGLGTSVSAKAERLR